MGFPEERMGEGTAKPGWGAEPNGWAGGELAKDFLTRLNFAALGGRPIGPEAFFGMGVGMVSDLVARRKNGSD